MWQMPSAWPSTGILVLRWMWLTRELLPLGMTRSMTSSRASRSLISSRVWIRWIRSGPRGPTASTMILCSAALECAASLPPLSSSPLPERRARDAIWGRASGLASKIMSSTPMGAVTLSRIRPSATSVRVSSLPMGSSWAAMARMPSARIWILAGLSTRRCSRESVMLPSASLMSLAFSARMRSWLAVRASATRCSMATRSEVGRACREREAARARCAMSRAELAAALLAWMAAGSNTVPTSTPDMMRGSTSCSFTLAITTGHTVCAWFQAAVIRAAPGWQLLPAPSVPAGLYVATTLPP
mmetsp:Transcript_37522/g.83523  ORF Transcript_37522/g.83523 Transcript_37522/m.83523 type:complete len:300 (-) Transcript_37522:394-1293(-)